MIKIYLKLRNLFAAGLLIFFSDPVSGQWTSHNGMAMTGNCFMIHAEPGALYVSMLSSLFSTSDGGVTWNYTDPGITVLTMAKHNNVIIASDGGVDIKKSTDGGNTWVSGNGDLPSSVNIQCFCYNGPVLFMASYSDGVYKSEDNGVTWTQVSSGLPMTGGSYQIINVILSVNSDIFVGTDAGVYKSNDDGSTWVLSSTGLPVEASTQTPRAITSLVSIGTRLFATPVNSGVYTSTNNGATWTNEGLGTWNCQVCVSDSILFICTTGHGLYKSADYGSNWSSLGLQSQEIIQAASAGTTLYALPSDYSSLLESVDNGATWNPPGNDLSPYLYTVFFNNSVIYTGGITPNYGTEPPTGVIQRSADNGVQWSTTALSYASEAIGNVTAFTSFGNSLFAGTTWASWVSNTGRLFKSDDNGTTWNSIDFTTGYVYGINCFAMNSNKIFAGTNAGVYSSSDGTSWTYKALDTHAINTLCFIGTTLYAGTDGGVYNSPDQGLTWGETGQGTSAFPVYSLCAVNGEIYAGTSFGILHYTDSLGVHYWYPANGGIINSSVISMVSYQNILFASTGDQHVYMTKTGGDTWGDITDNLTDSVMTIIIHNYNLYAATNGSGLWSRSLGDFTGINNRDENSTVSVFPNPARNKITIRLNGPSSHAFQVEISNLCGQVVFSGSYPVQSQETSVELDCSQLSLGLYTVRVITGTTSIAKKLIKQ